MAVITYETYDSEAMCDNMNLCKDVIVQLLFEHGHLTREQAEDYLKNYHVMIAKPSTFSRWWKKIFSEKDDQKSIIIVKNMTMKDNKPASKDV